MKTLPVRLKRLRGAIFDLDGTLLDTMNQWSALGVDYLKSRGIEPKADLQEKLTTTSLRGSAELFRDEYGVDLCVFQILESLKTQLSALYENDAKMKDGALETLRELRRQGVKTALATATSTEFATVGLRRNDALEYFDKLFSCKDSAIGVGKDAPKVFDAARAFLGTSLDETIVVEDALYAVETAKKAGYFVVAIEDECERPRRDAVRQLADVYVENHAQLLDWLREQRRTSEPPF